MSDKELVLELAKRLNLEYVDDTIWKDERYYDHGYNYNKKENIISLGYGIGYGGFYVNFYFDKDDNLINHGVWE